MKKLFLLLLSAFFFIVVSCKKENPYYGSQLSDITTTDLSGFGDRGGMPSGNPFYLPHYISQTTPMLGWDSTFVSYEVHGIGNIQAYFTLLNSINFPSSLTLPAGLIFLTNNDTLQSGLSVYPTTLTFAPKESKKIILRFYCMNRHKVAYSKSSYTMNVVSNNDQVLKLINTVKVKSEISLYNHSWELGEIVWHISDSTGLSQADLDSIQSW